MIRRTAWPESFGLRPFFVRQALWIVLGRMLRSLAERYVEGVDWLVEVLEY